MAEPTYLDALLGGGIAAVGALATYVLNRLRQIDNNRVDIASVDTKMETAIKSLEEKVDSLVTEVKALEEKGDADHTRIWKKVSSMSEDIAFMRGTLKSQQK